MSKILTNQAKIDYNDKSTETCKVVTLVEGSLEIYKSAVTDATDAEGNPLLSKDETFGYQITLVNHSESPFTGIEIPGTGTPLKTAIVVVDDIPAGLKFVDDSLFYTLNTGGTPTTEAPAKIAAESDYNDALSYTLDGNTLTVYIPSLPANSNGIISFNVQVDKTAEPVPVPGTTEYSNNATVDFYGNTSEEPVPSNEVAVKYSFAYIKAEKATDPEDSTVQCGGPIKYLITLTNEGDLPAKDVKIEDDLPLYNGAVTPPEPGITVNDADIVVSLDGNPLAKNTDYTLSFDSTTNKLLITGVPAVTPNPAKTLDIPGGSVLTVTIPGTVKC